MAQVTVTEGVRCRWCRRRLPEGSRAKTCGSGCRAQLSRARGTAWTALVQGSARAWEVFPRRLALDSRGALDLLAARTRHGRLATHWEALECALVLLASPAGAGLFERRASTNCGVAAVAAIRRAARDRELGEWEDAVTAALARSV